ncbi:hypothetical protein SPOG_02021 [Schizosaccharomyces cryophilus OY26]|uniref:Uncharacterized protein n=1 Tax=Schizosaccharomyces cryophilus (strain OY26 / ATCC MYA-4695 / CBS 11777 / NBRC 106824 / NRRL Y48691) TaxID=653667 RepID=S9W413_SCHCR|nr:uncharacterized protein SPOG_02021 [Schizosaccharomyces cryophilus OY26]EPY52700.1 hypothetical protein SPOG_02021 [Schizosaccharomyces cryophilus OY26]
MLLSFGISALLFAGTTLASVPYNHTDVSSGQIYRIDDANKPIFRKEEGLIFIPVESNVQAFASCNILNPTYDESDPAYAKIVQKPNTSGTVHLRMVQHPDLFQAYKHAIDGREDYRFLKNLNPNSDEDFYNVQLNFTSGTDSGYYMTKVTEPGMVCFLGYQEVDATEEPDPIIYMQYKSGEYRDSEPEHRIFVGLSVISGIIGLFWFVRCLCNPRKFTFTQSLLFLWYFAFLANHPMKRALFTDKNVFNHPYGFLIPLCSYYYGDGVERSLFNSFALALALNMGYLRRSSKKLVFLVILLGWVQLLFIVIAPLIFPILFLFGSPKATPLQLTWILFNYGYLFSLLGIRICQVYRMRLKLGVALGDKYMKSKKFVALLLFSILVSMMVHKPIAPTFDVSSEIAKTVNGVLSFCFLAWILNASGKVSEDNEPEILQNPYKDDPETGLLADEKF